MFKTKLNSTRSAVLSTLALVTVACSWLPTATIAAQEKPNIIVILSDDGGYSDFSFSGDANFATPNIKKLADTGVKFTQGYVSASVCSPSRAGMLTGRYQQRFGHEYNLPVKPEPGDDYDFNGMSVKEKTIADHLKAAGYRTGLIGKWHLGEAEQFHPNNRGFDDFYGLLGGGRSYFTGNKKDTDYTRMYRNQTPEPFEGYLTDKLGDEAISFIEKNQENPFFLYLSYTAVHAPMEAKKDQEALFEHIKDPGRRTLAAMTLALDESVGKVMARLDELELTENTLVVFLNDNGGPSDYNFSVNKPLSGVKGTLYEGGVRVPYIVSWPGKLPQGEVYTKPVSALDILPTSLAAAKAKPVNNKALDGVNLMPYLLGENDAKPHETLYWRRAAFAAIRDGDYKLVRFPDRLPVLYDLSKDIGEHNDLAAANPEIVGAMMKKLFTWETGLSSPYWTTHSKWIKQNRERYSIFTSVDKK